MGKKKVPQEPVPKQPTSIIHLLFIGYRKTRDDKKAGLWEEIELSQNDGSKLEYDSDKERVYSGSLLKGSFQVPGAIVSIEQIVGETTVYTDTAKLVGHWLNKEQAEEWAVTSRAKELEIDQTKEAVKKLKDTLPWENLDRFQRAYQNADNYRTRTQILAMVIERITNKRI